MTSGHKIESRALLQGMTVLVGALAWNEFGRRTLEHVKPKAGPVPTLLWAVIVTIILVIIISFWNAAAEAKNKLGSGSPHIPTNPINQFISRKLYNTA